MAAKKIELTKLTTCGKGQAAISDGVLDFWTTASPASVDFNLVNNCYKRHALMLPEKYKLPFRLDLKIKLDYPLLILLIGDGHIILYADNSHKLEDIAKQENKPNLDGGQFDNRLPLNEFVDISVIYDFKEMQILLNGEERFYTSKMPYMKAKNLLALNETGFGIGMVVTKLSTLTVREVTVTEFADKSDIRHQDRNEDEQATGRQAAPPTQGKHTFEELISRLPEQYRDEMLKMDEYLRMLQPMRFKRSVDKNGCKISYISSEFGISYLVKLSGSGLRQSFSWYIITAGKAETWHRKADYMEETLMETAKTDKGLAERIFYALNDCVGCYGSRCIVKTPYEFNGKKRLSCHGCAVFRMCSEDFQDVKDFFWHANELMKKKIAEGSLQTDKIYCIPRGK